MHIKFSLLISILVMSACSDKPMSVKMMESDSSNVMIADESLISDQRDMRLSEIAEDFRIVRFDNRDAAFFQGGLPAFSDNYIAVGKAPVKLFSRDGKYICNIGGIGNGPGEYAVGAYDILIDEPSGKIYVAGFNKNINCYDLNGNYMGTAGFNKPLNKGKLFPNSDSTVSAIQLCFKEDGNNSFVAANFNVGDSLGGPVRYAYTPQLSINRIDAEGKTVGFNHELWSFRCSDRASFHTTFNDTLYHYNAPENRLEAVFKLDMTPERKGEAFFVYQEMPNLIFANIVGGNNKGTIAVDKNTLEAWRVGDKINDYFFDVKWGWSFHDGYMFDIYEPLQLQERLQNALDEGNFTSDQVDKVKEFMATLHENDNNVMLVAKLKK